MNNTIKYFDKINDIKNRYSIPYTKENMREEHYVEIMYEELSIEMIKEIERLNNIINTMDKEIDNLCKNQKKEIKRLNNIINEFDKFLFGELQTYGGGGTIQEYYDKLQELKGSNDNG